MEVVAVLLDKVDVAVCNGGVVQNAIQIQLCGAAARGSGLDPQQIEWRGNVGMVRAEKRAGRLRYDLALREGDSLRIFYGVTEDGMEGAWSAFLAEES